MSFVRFVFWLTIIAMIGITSSLARSMGSRHRGGLKSTHENCNRHPASLNYDIDQQGRDIVSAALYCANLNMTLVPPDTDQGENDFIVALALCRGFKVHSLKRHNGQCVAVTRIGDELTYECVNCNDRLFVVCTDKASVYEEECGKSLPDANSIADFTCSNDGKFINTTCPARTTTTEKTTEIVTPCQSTGNVTTPTKPDGAVHIHGKMGLLSTVIFLIYIAIYYEEYI